MHQRPPSGRPRLALHASEDRALAHDRIDRLEEAAQAIVQKINAGGPGVGNPLKRPARSEQVLSGSWGPSLRSQSRLLQEAAWGSGAALSQAIRSQFGGSGVGDPLKRLARSEQVVSGGPRPQTPRIDFELLAMGLPHCPKQLPATALIGIAERALDPPT